MVKMVVHPGNKKSKIRKEIYGHFAEHLGRCIYEGIYVGEDSPIKNVNGMRQDVVEALKQIRVPVLRWPGGCFAEQYHWKDGIGPKKTRKKTVNTFWGGVVEDNSFGTHEFFELCRQLGCETYINGSLGGGTIQEMSDWIEYMTYEGDTTLVQERKRNGQQEPWKVDFFGMGNENWGCGGNMKPDYYANEYRKFQTFVPDYQPGHHIQKICCGANGDDYEWTKVVLDTCIHYTDIKQHGFMDGISLHYYVYPDGIEEKGSATEFDEASWYRTLRKALYMDELLQKHSEILDVYDPEKKIGLIVDEWGAWYTCESGTNPAFLYQQSTMRDALVAGITLNIFNKHSDRVTMANLAQAVNVLQAVILTKGEKMIKTPTYHIFDMYKYHQDACLVESSIEQEQIAWGDEKVQNLTESVSINAEGVLNITITNLSLEEGYDIDVSMDDWKTLKVKGEIVQGKMTDKNTWEDPDCVCVKTFDRVKITEKGIWFTMPACSVVYLEVTPEVKDENIKG